MKIYNPSEIEPKWQSRWEKDNLYCAEIDTKRPKHYALTMLPYTSGDLLIGHWYAMTPSDARARYKRMRGYNVMFPIGFDAFGLPADRAAMRNGIHPKIWTYANIDQMRKQLKSMGSMWDWHREAISCDPEYYHWTQWFFIQLFKHGLAYRNYSLVDWCQKDQTTLAREQVWGEDRHCELCGTPVIKKALEQWCFKGSDEMVAVIGKEAIGPSIARYAEDLPGPSRIMENPCLPRLLKKVQISRDVAGRRAGYPSGGWVPADEPFFSGLLGPPQGPAHRRRRSGP